MTAAVVRRRYYVGRTFVVEHAPASGRAARVVVLLPPLGYEDTCAYRPLRVLADHLAAVGHLVVRLDWPGLGDSAGDALDGDLHEQRLDAARAVAAAVRARGPARVVGFGVRAGALLALASGAFDDLILWGAPASGRRYVREEQAFASLAAESVLGAPPPPPGGVEAGGFVHGPAVVAALEQLDAAALVAAAGAVGRALLLGRDGAEPPAALARGLAAVGVEVTAGPAPGMADLLENPYHSSMSGEVVDRVSAWLQGASPAEVAPHAGAPALRPAPGVIERPWVSGGLSGVVCTPEGGVAPGAAWTVFYNAGGIRRSGPHRLWTTAARRLAARGFPSLRVDVRDVGDSDGVVTPHQDLVALYADTAIDDAAHAFDAVVALAAGSVDVVGLCSGAFLGMNVAARRDVRRAVLFNGMVLVWNPEARASSMTAHIRASLGDGRRWRRLLDGRINRAELARAIVVQAGVRAASAGRRLLGRPDPSPVARLVREVRRRGTQLTLVASAGDPSVDYLAQHMPGPDRPPVRIIPGVDHTIRPVWAHDIVLGLIVSTIE